MTLREQMITFAVLFVALEWLLVALGVCGVWIAAAWAVRILE